MYDAASGRTRTLSWASSEAAALERNPQLAPLLNALGCTLELAPGDAIFMAEDVYHRTQDLLADRVAMLINVQ